TAYFGKRRIHCSSQHAFVPPRVIHDDQAVLAPCNPALFVWCISTCDCSTRVLSWWGGSGDLSRAVPDDAALEGDTPMGTQSTSSLDMVIRNLTDAELHDLLARVQTELLHRPGQRSGLSVEVVTEDEAALLA